MVLADSLARRLARLICPGTAAVGVDVLALERADTPRPRPSVLYLFLVPCGTCRNWVCNGDFWTFDPSHTHRHPPPTYARGAGWEAAHRPETGLFRSFFNDTLHKVLPGRRGLVAQVIHLNRPLLAFPHSLSRRHHRRMHYAPILKRLHPRQRRLDTSPAKRFDACVCA